jgi:DNA-binding GntR family transcriptional regulator
VRRFTEKDVREIFQLREGIEGIAVREAVKNITPRQLAELSAVVAVLNQQDEDKSETADSASKRTYREADMQFHQLIVAASGNERLARIFRTAVLQSQSFFFVKAAAAMLGTAVTRSFSLVPHQSIYEAIMSRDGLEAERLIREHLRTGCEAIIKVTQVLGID